MKNELLEKVKEQVSIKRGYKSFRDLDNDIFRPFNKNEPSFSDEVAEAYAKEFAKAELEKLQEELYERYRKDIDLTYEHRANQHNNRKFTYRAVGYKYSAILINKRIEEI